MMTPFGQLESASKTDWSDEDNDDRDDNDFGDEKIDETVATEPPALVHQATTWITHQMRPIDKEYYIDEKKSLGEPGQFGTAYACWKHPTNFEKNSPEWTPELRCVKIINKARFHMITNKKERERVFETLAREIGILKKINHENIVQLFDVYENRNTIHLIMEYLPGGELFDRIAEQEDGFSEKDAANILNQILSALDYMHDRNIVHLDLKPENILFASKDSNKVKLIDFGMSRMAPRFAKLRDRVGTTAYMAPEVFKGQYSKAADVWSCGIILYCMIFGYPPFHVDEEQSDQLVFAAAEKVIEKQVTEKGFDASVKPGFGPWFPEDIPVSDHLMQLIGKMLDKNVKRRWTVKECLDSPWLRGQLSDKSMPTIVREGLQKFNRHCKFKVAVSKMFMDVIDAAHIQEIEDFFTKLDANGDGIITCEEFVTGMKKHYHTKLSTTKLVEMFENADIDGSQGLTIDELITVAAHRALIDEDERLFDVFQELDEDGDGVITHDELLKAARKEKRNGKYGRVKTLFINSATKEAVPNGDGKIDYEGFLRLIHPAFNDEMTLQEWESQAAVQTRVRSSTFDVDISAISFDFAKPQKKQPSTMHLDPSYASNTQSKRKITKSLFVKDSTRDVNKDTTVTKTNARKSITIENNDSQELALLKKEKKMWDQEKLKYEERISNLENEINLVREKYEKKLLDKIENQGNVIKDVQSIRDEWEEKYESKLLKYEERIHSKDDIISKKDELIQTLQENIVKKSEEIDNLNDDLFNKQNQCDNLKMMLQDAIDSKMESLQRMEEAMKEAISPKSNNANALLKPQNSNSAKRKTNHLSMMSFPNFI